MGHIIEHIALEIQTLAGMDTGFGRTRSYGEEGVYNVVFSYIEENVGRYAAKASVAICEALIVGELYNLDDLRLSFWYDAAEKVAEKRGAMGA